MSVFKPLHPKDIYITPFYVHKQLDITDSDMSSSQDINLFLGNYLYPINNLNDLSNTTMLNFPQYNGRYNHLVHNSINHLFYDNFNNDPSRTFSKYHPNQERLLHKSCSVLSVPYSYLGEGLKEGTLEILDYSSFGDELILNNNFSDGMTYWTSSTSISPAIVFTSSSNIPYITISPTQSINNPLAPSSSIYQSLDIHQQLSWSFESGKQYKIVTNIKNHSYISGVNVIIKNNGTDVFNSFYPTGSTSTLNIEDFYTAATTFSGSLYISASAYITGTAADIIGTPLLWLSLENISIKEAGVLKTLYDDSIGNVYDNSMKSTIQTTYHDNNDYLVGYWSFNECYVNPIDDRKHNIVLDHSIYNNTGYEKNITYSDGICGQKAIFNHKSETTSIINTEPSYSFINTLSTGSFISSGSIPSIYEFNDSITLPDSTYIYYSQSVTPTSISGSRLKIDTNVSLTAGRVYELSLYAKGVYTKSTPRISVALLENNTVEKYYHTKLDAFWNEYKFYFRPTITTGSYSFQVLYGYDENTSLYTNDVILVSKARVNEVTNKNYIRVPHDEIFNFRVDTNFAIEGIITIPEQQINVENDSNVILSKNGRKINIIANPNRDYSARLSAQTGSFNLTIDEMVVDVNNKYPYQIEVYNQHTINSGKLKCSRNNGNTIIEVTSSNTFNDNLPHHIVFQKSSSYVQLYVDGTLEGQTTDFPELLYPEMRRRMNDIKTHNNCDLMIGSFGNEIKSFTGEIDEIKIYNKPFSATEILNNSTAHLNQNMYYNVGNVFPEHGMVVITSPYENFNNIFRCTGSRGFTAKMKNTMTFYEFEINCSVEGNEFMVSNNPTLWKETDETHGYDIYNFATSSYFSPYVTTIGLYNDNAELVAIGKLSKPVKRLENVDTTYVVRFDI